MDPLEPNSSKRQDPNATQAPTAANPVNTADGSPADLPPLSGDALRLLAAERSAAPPAGAYERVAARLEIPVRPAMGASARWGLALGAVVVAGLAIWRLSPGEAPPAALVAAEGSRAPSAPPQHATPPTAPGVPRPEAPTAAPTPEPAASPSPRNAASPTPTGAPRAVEAPRTEAEVTVATRAPDPEDGATRREAVVEPARPSETSLLTRARAAVRSGAPGRALRLLDEHRRGYPSGRLAEEREALTVVALVRAGRTELGRRAAQRFLAQHPGSVHRALVESAVQQNP